MAKVITAAQAAELIKDGATVAYAVSGLAGWPEEVGLAIGERFRNTGHPKGITQVHGPGAGDWKGRGECAMAEEGLIKRLIVAHVGSSPRMARLVEENKAECYFLPQGVIAQLYLEIGRKGPGVLSKVGLGTFIDPRIEGGKVNDITTEDILKVVEFEGEEWMFYPSFPIDVALLRGTVADENGNFTIDKEGKSLDNLPVAQAVKASGGIVIVQVETLVKAGTLHPKRVKVPGVLVDYIVVAQKPQWQSMVTVYNPSFSGDARVPLGSVPPLPLDERKVICRRSAMELAPGPVNLGIGIPQGIANVATEEGVGDIMIPISELGNIGGLPGVGGDFGHHWNPEATVDHNFHQSWFDGVGVDLAFFGLAETDKDGNVNASKFGGKVMGVGGFINITTNCKKAVFCGTFTAGGLQLEVKDGKLAIIKEGRQKKFLDQVGQISYSGKYAVSINKPTLFITERAVFELTKEGMVLTEIAPGVDLEKDILALMDFKPIISPDLKLMDEGIFQPVWGRLKDIVKKD
ncbi:Acetate CoA-transferase YdiF [Pelotomaculum sp. FP]|uniref:acyl CoA:acetate/3-ketoacid CoA transferase n=1 Tax=Pelotomaculum sp. FP TaxID=261474 RepID=UPI001064827B|nr:malonate decarboxylase subunit alpha [Pelotomaculum sp. FP]TEB14719.1 Acetate CoA-transferase YdiF [Pelotomaculum sp. FP]